MGEQRAGRQDRHDVSAVPAWHHQGAALWIQRGGAATSFYQAVAEAGIGYCNGATKLVKCGNELAGLPRADGIILVDTNPGNAASALRRLNGAVTNDKAILERGEAAQIDPTLDPFNPANGYNPKGGSHYSDAFAARYFAAQTARMNRLIDLAQARLQRDRIGHGRFTDDDVFLLVKAGGRTVLLDPSIHHTTRRPQKVLKNDGSVVIQVAASVRVAQPEQASQNRSFALGTMLLTLRSFLSAYADIRSRHAMDDVDWCSTNNSVPCAVRSISSPVLRSPPWAATTTSGSMKRTSTWPRAGTRTTSSWTAQTTIGLRACRARPHPGSTATR